MTENSLQGLRALVTGGSRGIGREICIALAQRGAKVAINYRSNKDMADQLVEHIAKEFGAEAVLAPFDVADPDASKQGVDAVTEALGGIDILVNNAGIARNGLLLRVKEEDIEKSIQINLTGALRLSKLCAQSILRARDKGRIIMVSSVVGETGNAGQAVYSATKAGLLGLTKSLAREFASRSVCVNAVSPGFIDTDMTSENMSDDAKSAALAAIPLGRMGSAKEVAEVVAFLASQSASYVTGQVVRVNGGMLM